MKTVCIDAGHGGIDPGGRSLGTPEKHLALRYAMRLGKYLTMAGVRVIQTRTTDVALSVADRARKANEAGADLFISVHANASDNPDASGPWTIYAAPSSAGRRAAAHFQAALFQTLGGKLDAFYPDASSRVGYTKDAAAAIAAGRKEGLSPTASLRRAGITQPYRTIGVLRQTKMPAVLLELGFMTNASDLAELEDSNVEVRLCQALAEAALEVLGVKAVPALRPPEVAAPNLVAPLPPSLVRLPFPERIEVPTREHVERIVQVRGLAPDAARPGVEVAEVLLRAVARGAEVGGRDAAKRTADALADWIKARAS